ncbi:ABC transporter substrate-binding protein [Nesterenkonia ebinurensis]|uniref:ABC transporter substrate-binding protein n=1 Tax=Nesterenkonia ebinurensis TaxID=2608252 RepID=UPI00123CCD55|nr:ABC transporter substrate-binding protein [Nesterenkonia ebinurensis]
MSASLARRAVALCLAGTLALTACSGGNTAQSDSDSNGAQASGETLVIDTAFSLETGDPGRNYVPTGSTVLHPIYETLLTFEGDDESEPVPGLATMEVNEDATEFTFTLDEGRVFSDGSPIEADDVVFSFERLKGMEASKANHLVVDIDIEKVDDMTVRMTTEEPYLQLPAIVTNPALSVLNSEVVQENGGTTDDSDAAEEFLNGTSVGSGPYQLETFDLTSQVVLVPNEEYNGDQPAQFERVVVRNVSEAATQLTNLRGGDSDLALDLSGDQVAELGDDFDITAGPGAQTIFLLVNQDDEVFGDLANPAFAEAVRYALDYDSLLELAGEGAAQATGVIPPMFLGALEDGVEQDLVRAAAALEESGYDGETLTLRFPNDQPIGGVDFTTLAERIQSQLAEAGINVDLAPGPFASEIDPYVEGTADFAMWYWGPDFADSSSFLPFGPDETVGTRSGWTAEDAPEIADLVAQARTATDLDEREQAFADFAAALQEEGPFIPLLVPARSFASTDVDGVTYNSNWTIDIAELSPAD